MADQEAKAALNPVVQFLFNLQHGGYEAINPDIVHDPSYQKLKEFITFAAPEPDDPLNYISAGDPRLAAGILAAKKAKKLIKGAPAIKKTDEGEAYAKQLNREMLAHGSTTRGIKKLRKGRSGQSVKSGRYKPEDLEATGGTYLTRGIMDPRLLDYIKKRGSVYLVNPSFQRTLNTGRVPSQVRKLVNKEIAVSNKHLPPRQEYETLADYLKGGGNFYSKQLARVVDPRHASSYNPSKPSWMPPYPTRIQGEVADFFRKYGYDSLRFKPTPAFKDTIIALDPENTLDIIEEIPYEELLRKLIEMS
tara:strand:- start:190 stop:1104 length:915 start_codon:yes stop_codon:yes gene_type:complete